MKYLKIFEKYSKIRNDIIKAVRDVDEGGPWMYDENEYFEDCPFENELLLLHQKEYIEDMYWNSHMEWTISIGEFTKEYNLMIDEAKEKILSEILKNPQLYSKYGEYIENLGIKLPGWMDQSNKYNL